MIRITTNQPIWGYATEGNGLFVAVYAPDGRSCLVQGDEATDLLARIDTAESRADPAPVLAEYDEVCD